MRSHHGYDRPKRFFFADDPAWYQTYVQLRQLRKMDKITPQECSAAIRAVQGVPVDAVLLKFLKVAKNALPVEWFFAISAHPGKVCERCHGRGKINMVISAGCHRTERCDQCHGEGLVRIDNEK